MKPSTKRVIIIGSLLTLAGVGGFLLWKRKHTSSDSSDNTSTDSSAQPDSSTDVSSTGTDNKTGTTLGDKPKATAIIKGKAKTKAGQIPYYSDLYLKTDSALIFSQPMVNPMAVIGKVVSSSTPFGKYLGEASNGFVKVRSTTGAVQGDGYILKGAVKTTA